MGRLMSKVGAFCVRFRWPVVIVWVLLAVGLTLLTSNLPSTYNNNVVLPGTGSQAAFDLMSEKFPPQQNGSSPAVYHVTKGKIDDNGPNQKAITDAYKQLKQQKQVDAVTNPFKQPQAGYVSEDGKYAFMPILLKINTNDLSVKEAKSLYDIAVEGPQKQGMTAAVGGPIGSTLLVVDTGPSERLGMLAAALILLLAFGSIVAMGMPLISASIGLSVGIAAIWFVALVLDIPSVGATMASMIGLGVGIDYALFMVNRQRRLILEDGLDPRTAAVHATGTVGGSILFAGSTVVIALVSLTVAGIPFIAGLGYAAATAVALVCVAAVTLLPALLAIVGKWIVRLRVPVVARRTDHPIGSRWAGMVTGHPVLAVIIPVALLIPLMIPATTMVLGQQDMAVSPKGSSQRVAFDLMSQGFGAGFNGPLVAAMSLDPDAKPSNKYTKQYDEATSLQNELEAEQQSLTTQQQELEEQQAILEQSADELQAQAEELQAEATALEAEETSLKAEAAALQQQEAQLEQQGRRLADEARRLATEVEQRVAKERTLLKELRRGRIAIRILERRIQRAVLPPVQERLEKRLAQRLKQQRSLRKSLRKNTEALRALRGQVEQLRKQIEEVENEAKELAAEGRALAAQGEQLAAQGAQLAAEGQELQEQEAALQAQAASLQEWGDQLQQEADQAQQQQKQAEQLQKELTKELTKAGGDPRGTDPRIVKMQNALAQPSDVFEVSPPQINKSGDAVLMSVIPKTQPAAPKTADLVTQLRDQTIPPATSPGMAVYVGGSTASNVDLAALITQKLPLVIGTVVLLSSFLLMLAFRSWLVPLQAAIANILAAAAAFGVLTAVFQWGWGLSLIGIHTWDNSLPVISYVPLMMFAALFGLSMDYQVFVISTVQTEMAKGTAAKQAIKDGLAYAGRIVMTAATIMMSVFGSFVLNDDSVIKQFGVGLTVAVALAATMSLLFTPAVLTLTHRHAFSLPRWMDKILPDLDIEGRKLEKQWADEEAGHATADADEDTVPTGSTSAVPAADILPGGTHQDPSGPRPG